MNKIRIVCTDKSLANVAYIYNTERSGWCCALANGTPASFSYAGISGDQMALQFALDDTATPEEALAVVKARGGNHYDYKLFSAKVAA